jgi:porphobilinogen deaminase
MRAAFVLAMILAVALISSRPTAAETGATTGSAGPFIYVTVVGAPGDGDQALTAALTKQLEGRGLKAAEAVQTNAYEVQGTVTVAAAANGKDSITIIWVVMSPDGDQLGVTRQTNEVRKGSLGRTWGNAAEAAAAAAAADIAKLIRRD